MLERPVAALFHQLSDLLPHTHLSLTLPAALASAGNARHDPAQGLCTSCSLYLGHSSCTEPQGSLLQPQGLRPLSTTLFKIATCPQPRTPPPLYPLPEHWSPSHQLRNSFMMFFACCLFPLLDCEHISRACSVHCRVPSARHRLGAQQHVPNVTTQYRAEAATLAIRALTSAHAGGHAPEETQRSTRHRGSFQPRTPHLPGLPGPRPCSKTQPGTLCHVPTSQRLQP